eukprot:145215_1
MYKINKRPQDDDSDEDSNKQHKNVAAQNILCEIYSRAQAKWVNGKITKQFEFEKEQWLIVEYSNNTFEELKKDSKYIRFNTTPVSTTTTGKCKQFKVPTSKWTKSLLGINQLADETINKLNANCYNG